MHSGLGRPLIPTLRTEAVTLDLGAEREYSTDCTFLTADDLHYDILLGLPFLGLHHGVVDCYNKTVSLGEVTLQDNPRMKDLVHSIVNNIEREVPDNLLTAQQFERFVFNTDADDCLTCFVTKSDKGQVHLSTQVNESLVHLLTVDDAWDTIATGMAPSNLKPTTLAQFKTLLSKFAADVLNETEELNDQPSRVHADCSPVDHSIDTEGKQPPQSRMIRLPEHLKEELKKQVSALLKAGLIRPSSSPFAAPVLFAQKKQNGQFSGWRMCIDYRALNAQTVKDKFPIPTADELFRNVRGSVYFTKIDLKWGYWQIRINKDDIAKTAFRCFLGHYEWLVGAF
eukprot:3940495-Rhodomonas_salina.1